MHLSATIKTRRYILLTLYILSTWNNRIDIFSPQHLVLYRLPKSWFQAPSFPLIERKWTWHQLSRFACYVIIMWCYLYLRKLYDYDSVLCQLIDIALLAGNNFFYNHNLILRWPWCHWSLQMVFDRCIACNKLVSCFNARNSFLFGFSWAELYFNQCHVKS